MINETLKHNTSQFKREKRKAYPIKSKLLSALTGTKMTNARASFLINYK